MTCYITAEGRLAADVFGARCGKQQQDEKQMYDRGLFHGNHRRRAQQTKMKQNVSKGVWMDESVCEMVQKV